VLQLVTVSAPDVDAAAADAALAWPDGSSDEPLAEVVIIASTPLRGAELPEEHYAGSVQRASATDIHRARGATLADALERNLAGITLNETQGSPFMPDLNYRGFTASPLLGLPQGLAVYQNGTRLNEPFGDTLAWDLIPEFAIREATLVTGLNPTYGLNALGGALSLRMKDGFSFQGARASALGGSFERWRGMIEAGFERGGWAAYAGGDVLHETGWRDHSPIDMRRLYTDLRHRTEHGELALNATLANTALTGNGPAPLELLDERRQAVFTYPDQTKTALALLGAEAAWSLAQALDLSATAYFRASSRRTFNGDAAELEPCDDEPGVLCEEGEPEPVPSTGGFPIPASAGGDAARNTTRTRGASGGGTLQLVSHRPWFDLQNQLALGAFVARSRDDFRQRVEVGAIRPDRGVTPSGFFRGDEEGEVDLRVTGTHLGLYGADTLALSRQLSLTLSGRWNGFGIRLRDRRGDELDGDHRFSRFNPAAGLAYVPSPGLALYANYSEANRAPTAAELSCADPEAPCRLPNAFLSDPPLEQVVTRSAELGARLHRELDPERSLSASFALYAARSARDLLFVAGSLAGTGYFRNAGTTERAGIELALSARLGPFRPYLRYQLLRATFESSLILPGANHPDALSTPEGDVIIVSPGDRIPTLPMHSGRLGAEVDPIPGLSAGAWLVLSSSQYHRGDESNQLAPVPGYVSLNASARYELSSRTSLFVQASNLLDARFSTFGLLGQPDEVIPGAEDPRYASPALPRAVWAGVDLWLSP
jgi:outer membrane receptor protein involved in Fe transport